MFDPDPLPRYFGRFLDHVGANASGVLAVDGKTLRRSFDGAAGTSRMLTVKAFAADARLVVGHRAMAAGENEIVAARALLGCLDLGGTLVTADAIHCQRATAEMVLELLLFELGRMHRSRNGETVAAFVGFEAGERVWDCRPYPTIPGLKAAA